MIAASVYSSPAFVAVAAGVPSLILGLLGFRRSQHVDAVAEQAGIATAESGTIAQVIDGLNKIIAALQADNSVLREDKVALAECQRQLADVLSRLPRAPDQGTP